MLEKNIGHGIARRTSVSNCTYEYIALMDADDISLPDRFERELSLMIKENTDVVGGDIVEFIGNEENAAGKRCVPCCDSEIKEYMKKDALLTK